jgi:hypothetical protein
MSSNETENPFPPGSVATPNVGIDWYRATPWWRVIRPIVNLSWRASHVLLCCAGILATWSLFRLCESLFQPEQSTSSWFLTRPLLYSPVASGVDIGAPSYLDVWGMYLGPINSWLQSQTVRVTACSIAQVLAIAAVWTYIGGCLVRRSVVECATGVSAPWMETFQYVFRRWQSIAWSVTMPAAALLMIGIVPFLLGGVSRIPWLGWWLSALCLIPLMMAVLGIAWCAAITLLGFPLSVCTIVTEKKADAFDGISRSAAYVFQRPLIVLMFVAGATFVSRLAGEVFGALVWVGRTVVVTGYEWGASHETLAQQSFLLDGIPKLLVTGFGVSFFWSVAAAMYLVLRKDIDHTEFDVIDYDTAPQPEPAKSAPALLPASDASTDVG